MKYRCENGKSILIKVKILLSIWRSICNNKRSKNYLRTAAMQNNKLADGQIEGFPENDSYF